MLRICSFPPIEDARARVLILGSMPGGASLAAGQYYAHARNLFWPIMLELLGGAPGLSYAQRIRLLKSNGIALWDVLESCVREGSLDSAIEEATIAVNDFASFYKRHPRIGHVFFNGAKAEASYRRYVRTAVDVIGPPRVYLRLPSTSPAHAAMPFGKKLEAWGAVVLPHRRAASSALRSASRSAAERARDLPRKN